MIVLRSLVPAAIMASSFSSLAVPHLLALLFLVVVAPLPLPTTAADDGTTHLHLFMHDVATGSAPTAVQVIKGPAAGAAPGLAFGDTYAIDDALTETSSPASAAVGRAQGLYMMSSQSGVVLTVAANLVLTAGDHNGSTIAVMGRDDIAADVRELAVVGGTGRFRMASGYVLWKTASMKGPDATIELDVYVTTGTAARGGGAATDASAPVSTAARVEGWASACVIAMLAAATVSW